MSTSPAAFEGAAHGGARSRAVSRFYLGLAAVLFVVVLLGFSRTLYFRAFFDVRPIGFWVWIHGIGLTTWFVGIVLQTTLVAVQRTDVHRRLGWALAALAVVVVGTSAWITMGTVPAMVATGFDATTVAALGPRVAWGNYASAFTFAVLVGAAVSLRRHTQAHKRLMLLASISIISPALARVLQWPVFGAVVNDNFVVAAIVGSFVLAGIVAAHDLATQKRLHPATLVGVALLVGAKLAAVLVIAPSAFGRALVPGLP